MGRIARVQISLAAIGGRSNPISLDPQDWQGRYRPHVRVSGGDGSYLGVQCFEGPELLRLGEIATASMHLMYEPRVNYGAQIAGSMFEILEGDRVVGTGQVICFDGREEESK